MRFVLAISALVLSGIMLILGIGQVTFLAGPHSVVYSEEFDSPSGLAVIDASQFDALNGQTNVSISGPTPFIAVGKTRDVQAWAAPFEHAEVEVDAQNEALVLRTVREDAEAAEVYAALVEAEPDEQIAVPSPYGSDLWLEQRGVDPDAPEEADAEDDAQAGDIAQDEGVGSVRLPVSLSEDQSVLIALAQPEDDEAQQAAPGQISIEWVQDRRTPWAGPLLVAGGVLALIGALLYLLAVDHDRRGLGPRRGRRGPLLGIRNIFGRPRRAKGNGESGEPGSAARTADASAPRAARLRRAVALPALGLAAALALSGCSPSYWPDLSKQTEQEAPQESESDSATTVAPVPVSQAQIDRIISEIAALAGEADDKLDTSELKTRFTGDALAERAANYKIRKAVSDYEVVVPRISDEQLGYQLVQSTEAWPRTVFVVVASENPDAADAEVADAEAADAESSDGEAPAEEEQDSPSLALIMTQQSPHENFLVSRTIALRGGITMPEAAPAEEGTALLADDLQTLALTPAEVGPAYASILAGGTDVEQAEHFDLEGDSLIERSGAAWVAQSASAASSAGQGIQYSVSAKQSDETIVSLSTGVGGALVATTVLETRVEAPEEGGRWRPTVPKSLAALSGLEGQQEKLVSVVAHQLLFYVPGKTSEEPIQLLGYTSDLVDAGNG